VSPPSLETPATAALITVFLVHRLSDAPQRGARREEFLRATAPACLLLGTPAFVPEPKERKTSAAPFRERLKHRFPHATLTRVVPDDYRAGRISFAELDVSVKAWVNHVRYADTWGLRRHVFSGLRFSRVPTGSPGATRP
jgi:hypothetical protein